MRSPIISLAGQRDQGHHPGLILQRYLAKPATGEGGDPAERRGLLAAAMKAARSNALLAYYADAYHRWNMSFSQDGCHATEELKTAGRLIVGLGAENVLETGLRLHHTYGVPIIPGAALKGLAAHYCHEVWGQRRSTNVAADNLPYQRGGDFHKYAFGTTDDGGWITFYDAWITPDSLDQGALRLDVMTPHHPKWQTNEAPPTDFDRPVPVTFLSVTGTFLVRLSWSGPIDVPRDVAAGWTNRTMALLKAALAEWGVGGKTSSGYGRLVDLPPPPPPTKRPSGMQAKVRIVALRPKGFEVQDLEHGRNAGTLTLGTRPADADTNIGAIVDVLIHVDEPKRPQYKWPHSAKK